MNKSGLGWRTGISGGRSSPSTAEASAAIGASNRAGEGSIVISLTPELQSSFHIRKRIIVISNSLPRYRHFGYAWEGGKAGQVLTSSWIRLFVTLDSPFRHIGFPPRQIWPKHPRTSACFRLSPILVPNTV